jgi:hypothetical protein
MKFDFGCPFDKYVGIISLSIEYPSAFLIFKFEV